MKKYRLEDTFNAMLDLSILQGNPVVNHYPALPSVIEKYRNYLSNVEQSISSRKGAQDYLDQEYTQEITAKGNDIYEVRWLVGKAKQLIHNYQLPLYRFSLDWAINLVDQLNINQSHLKYALNNEAPIIIVQYLVAQPHEHLAIDGNHRVFAKFKSKKTFIDGYVIPHKLQLEALATELDRALYKVHYNMGIIVNHLLGIADKKKMHEILFPI